MSFPTVAVIGLGRLGRAIATRLTNAGFAVSGWSRSGASVPNVAPVASFELNADVVVLCVFDAAACSEVLSRFSLRPEAVVINITTVSPDEAADLADRFPAGGHVHAPVIGSVSAAMSGTLKLVAGGRKDDVDQARAVLEVLGDVVEAGSVADAARIKLVANGGLAAALLALGEARTAAAGLVDEGEALSLLARGPLAAVVALKRAWLEDESLPAHFTVAALAKDLALLAAAGPGRDALLPTRVAAALASGAVRPDDDIAALARPRPGQNLDHGLSIAPGVTAAADVLSPLVAYARGHATGDPDHMRDAFLSTAHIEGMRDGEFSSWTLDTYLGFFPGTPAADEPERRRRIDQVTVDGTVGNATMSLSHGPDEFIDMFVLLRVGDQWRIANKVYHRQ